MTMNLFFVATGFTPGFSGQSCVGGGFAGTVISRRGAEALSFFGDGFGSGHLGGMTSVSSVTDTIFASGHWGGMTSVSSGTDAGEADLTNRP
jgi:hypothetical protein